jgi:hypothetical protein
MNTHRPDATGALSVLPLGDILPLGWMRAQMRRDLQQGYAGCLDRLTPRAATDLFSQRIGATPEQQSWWDAETRGNWLWGTTMMAFMAGLPEHQARVSALLQALMATQDEDGYIGIYTPATRYAHGAAENGELWAQSRALLPLLALHEFTGDASCLAAVRAAVDLTLARHADGRLAFSLPARAQDITGMTHGLCFIDVLQWLHGLTGDARYRDFAQRMYADFARLPLPFQNDDMAPAALCDPRRPLAGHAVHTAEHLRAVLWAAPHDRALHEAALAKLRRYCTPSGALVGDESLRGPPTPEIGYEYCTLTELLFSLTQAVQALGDPALADWIETLAFNAAQGARLADGSAINYLACDTRLAATARRPDSYSWLAGHHGRFKFSPTHEDVACCCNPNAMRLLPHYVSRMWMALPGGRGLVLMLYGPGAVDTQVAGARVQITQHTNYPFEDEIRLQVACQPPTALALHLRRPGWATTVSVCVQGRTVDGVREEGGFIVIDRTWGADERITLGFGAAVRMLPYAGGEQHAVLRGALQFVQPVPHRSRALKTYAGSALHDQELWPADPAQAQSPVVLHTGQPDLGFTVQHAPRSDTEHPWQAPPLRLQQGAATLVPMGCAMLRRAAFAADPPTAE